MKVGIIGGTGGMGRGFAMRWSSTLKGHGIMIGSRDAQKAQDAAASYKKDADAAYGTDTDITGSDNVSVAQKSDMLILAIPYKNIDVTCPAILPHIPDGCTVVSPIVPMEKTKTGFEFIPIRDGAKTAHDSVAAHMKDPSRLVSAFHVISEKKLANPDVSLNYDIFVCGDGDDQVSAVCDFISEIDGLRPLRVGPGRLAYMAEISTPLLLNVMIRNGMRNPGIKMV